MTGSVLATIGFLNTAFIWAVGAKYLARRTMNPLYPQDSGMEAVILVQMILTVIVIVSFLF